ncbi:hypothetical protein RA210_U40386 [Rubrivivax sp. A210]|nr:hypothetical protein RA210_U40386 [Rubrivivax sp. A210]
MQAGRSRGLGPRRGRRDGGAGDGAWNPRGGIEGAAAPGNATLRAWWLMYLSYNLTIIAAFDLQI